MMKSGNLSSMRFISKADVYKNGVHAATIERDRQGLIHFSYLPTYSGPALASTLPVNRPGSSTASPGLPPYFAGLLPEGYRLELLRTRIKTSPDDELSILLAVGSDLPGDVQVLEQGIEPSSSPGNNERVDTAFADMDFRDLFDIVDTSGIPGVQPKVSSAMLSLPITRGSAGAILKITPPAYPFLIENEKHHLDAARHLKIPVASSELVFDKNNEAGLLVHRFDRVLRADGTIRRLAMEDGAQLLGVLPSQKYSVTAEELVQAVTSGASARPVATRNLFMQFFFAWLSGNGDLHAKNISIVETRPGRWEVAPIYDIPCTAVFRDFEMALPISGRIKNVKAKHWVDFIHTIGLPKRAARSAIDLTLSASGLLDLATVGYEGSSLHGAQREISHRRHEAATLLENL